MAYLFFYLVGYYFFIVAVSDGLLGAAVLALVAGAVAATESAIIFCSGAVMATLSATILDAGIDSVCSFTDCVDTVS